MPDEQPGHQRRSRVRLYLPFLLLLLLGIGWTVAWFVIRDRVVSGLDEWLQAEATAGRRWTCTDRSVGGYPFRIELGCSALLLERPDVSATLGRVLVLAQVYRPNHVIAEAAGPLRIVAGPTVADASWRLLQASVMTSPGAQRLSLATDDLRLRVASPDAAPVEVTARRYEMHVRPAPADQAAADLAVTTTGATIPGLDALVGGSEAADLDLRVNLTQVADLPARPLWNELERWRLSGGRLTLGRLAVVKGARRIEAQGSLGIDELHRPEGQITGAAVGLEGYLGRFVGEKAGLVGGLLGALTDAGPKAEIRQGDASQAPADPNAPRLRPLPTLRLSGGRLLVGPLAVPGIRIPPLY